MHSHESKLNGPLQSLHLLEHNVAHLRGIIKTLSSGPECSGTAQPLSAVEASVGHILTRQIHQLVEEKEKYAREKKLRSNTKEFTKSLKRKREEREEESRLKKECICIIQTHKKEVCHACGNPFLRHEAYCKRNVVAVSATAAIKASEACKRGPDPAIATKEPNEGSKTLPPQEETDQRICRKVRRKQWMKQVQRRLDHDKALRKQRAANLSTGATGSVHPPHAVRKTPTRWTEWEVYECERCTRNTCIEERTQAATASRHDATEDEKSLKNSKSVDRGTVAVANTTSQSEHGVPVFSQQTNKSNRKRRKQGGSSLEALLQVKHRNDAARQAHSFDLLDFMNSS